MSHPADFGMGTWETDLRQAFDQIEEDDQKEREKPSDEQMIENAKKQLQDRTKEEIIDNYCNLVKLLFALLNAKEILEQEKLEYEKSNQVLEK